MNAFLNSQVSWSVLYALSALFGGALLLFAFLRWRHRLRLTLVSGWVGAQSAPSAEAEAGDEPSEEAGDEAQPKDFGHVCLAGARALAPTRRAPRPKAPPARPLPPRPAPAPAPEPKAPPAQPDDDFLAFVDEVRAAEHARERAGRTPKQELTVLRRRAAQARRQLNAELAGETERPFLPLRKAVTRRVPRVKRGRPRGVTVRLRRPQPLPGFQEAVPFQRVATTPARPEAPEAPESVAATQRPEANPAEGAALLDASPAQGAALLDASPTQGAALLDASPTQGAALLDASPAQGPALLDASPTQGPAFLDASPTQGAALLDASPTQASDSASGSGALAALRALAEELERAPDPVRAEALGVELSQLGRRFAQIAAQDLLEVSDAA